MMLDAIRERRVAYDPSGAEIVHLESDMRIRFIPNRQQRPGGNKRERNLPYYFGDPHDLNLCSLCRPGHAIFGEILINGRCYNIMPNEFPIDIGHLLVLKESSSAADLSQFLQSESEVVDMLTLSRYLMPEYLLFFNCLPSRNSSDAGASVNHWHSQMLKIEEGIFHGKLKRGYTEADGVKIGTLKKRFVNCRVFEGDDIEKVSRYAFKYISILNKKKISYNAVFLQRGKGLFRIVIIPRGNSNGAIKILDRIVYGCCGTTELHGSFTASDHRLFDGLKKSDEKKARIDFLKVFYAAGLPERELSGLDEAFFSSL